MNLKIIYANLNYTTFTFIVFTFIYQRFGLAKKATGVLSNNLLLTLNIFPQERDTLLSVAIVHNCDFSVAQDATPRNALVIASIQHAPW